MRLLLLAALPLAGVLLVAGCRLPSSDEAASAPIDTASVAPDTVTIGAQVLVENDFRQLQDQRVGLIANHTSTVDGVHLIDLLDQAPNVELAALFGPEHGLRGKADAGEAVAGGRDPKTGVPIYSLYGDTRQPTPAMLDGLDALVFDVQEVGTRFYTYISTMGLAMQAAADAGLSFVVLDRPNPLGGEHVAGFVLNEEQASFVGMYPIPVQHSLTVGELARMIQGEGWLDGLETLELEVVPLEHWDRSMLWPDTELPWIAPSPNLPTFETALVYPGAAFFEATSGSEGRGTARPFMLIGAPWADAQALADTLNTRGLAGVRFEPARFTPERRPGAAQPKLEGEPLQGVRYVITDRQAFRPVAAGVHALHAFYQQAPEDADFIARPAWLAKLAGTERFHEMLTAGRRPAAIVASWQDAVQAFRKKRQPYLLY